MTQLIAVLTVEQKDSLIGKLVILKVFDFAPARVPIIEENLIINTRTPWVYYGVANLAPQELIRLYNTSPTHRAAANSKWYAV